jgi:hypothetical protein
MQDRVGIRLAEQPGSISKRNGIALFIQRKGEIQVIAAALGAYHRRQ